MFQPRHFIRYCIPIVMAAMCSFFALSPSASYAQDSITELVENVNASGKERTSKELRVLSELGMGVLGAIAGAGIGTGIGFACGYWIVGGFVGILALPPLTAGGVYLGGWLTGGRAEVWPSFAGAYVGASVAGIVTISLALADYEEECELTGLVLFPLLTLVGAVVGYELSENSATDRLRAERDGLRGPTARRSAPIMIQLYSGTF